MREPVFNFKQILFRFRPRWCVLRPNQESVWPCLFGGGVAWPRGKRGSHVRFPQCPSARHWQHWPQKLYLGNGQPTLLLVGMPTLPLAARRGWV